MGNVYNRKTKPTKNQKEKGRDPRSTDTGTPNGPPGGANVRCGREEPSVPVEPSVCQDERPQPFTPLPMIQFGFDLNSPVGQPWLSGTGQA